MIQRREFITLPGGAAAAWPSAAWGQQSKMPLLGLLGGADPVGYAPQIKALRVGLRDFGYIEGKPSPLNIAGLRADTIVFRH